MDVVFWGTRGSTPTPIASQTIEQKIRAALRGAVGLDLHAPGAIDTYIANLPRNIRGTTGGNTTCVEVCVGNDLLVIDAGSGMRLLGESLMQRGYDTGNSAINVLITHTHWDHIQGFPFFAPAFVPTNEITFHSPFSDLQERLATQQQQAFFPVPVHAMHATLRFHTLPVAEWVALGGFQVQTMRQIHPGGSYAYRIECGDVALVFASDTEFPDLSDRHANDTIAFYRDADVLIFDAQYGSTEITQRPRWGHSSAVIGAELAIRAGVRHLVLFHHDPSSSDETIWRYRDQAVAYLHDQHTARGVPVPQITVAYDGMHLHL